MKTCFTLLTALIFPFALSAQQFEWAGSYDIPNSYSVAAIDTDESGNIITAGIFNPSPNWPYHGPVSVQKMNAEGDSLWNYDLNGLIIPGDMATVGDNILIIGQSNGQFTYRGTNYGQYPYCMFVIMLDSNGEVLWHFSEVDKWGQNTNIAVGNNGEIALHIRGEGNLTDWIYIIDTDGNMLQQKHVNENFTLVMDIAYYDGRLYFNGSFFGPGTTMVDTILVELPEFENASITMGFDEDLTAQWLYTGQTINNFVGQIEADEHDLVVYEPRVDNFFNSIHSLKRFDFDGELLTEIEIPTYSTFAVVKPDLAKTPDYIGLYMQNSNSGSEHIARIYDNEFNLVSVKEVTGASETWGGKIAHYENDIFISHVHSASVNFNDELSLEHSGTGQNIYVAKIGSETTGIGNQHNHECHQAISPNPAGNFIRIDNLNVTVEINTLKIFNRSGQLVKAIENVNSGTTIHINDLTPGLYFIQGKGADGKVISGKFVKTGQ